MLTMILIIDITAYFHINLAYHRAHCFTVPLIYLSILRNTKASQHA